jgi:hypothetical protein
MKKDECRMKHEPICGTVARMNTPIAKTTLLIGTLLTALFSALAGTPPGITTPLRARQAAPCDKPCMRLLKITQ